MRKYFKRKPRVFKKKVGKAVKRYVKRVIDRQIEDKYYQNTGTLNISNSDGSLSTAVFIPNITQGSNPGTRVGQKVKIKSVRFDFTVREEASDPAQLTPASPFNNAEIRWALSNYKMQTGFPLCTTPADSFYNSDKQNTIWTNINANVIAVNQRKFETFEAVKVLRQGTKYLQVYGGSVNNPLSYKKSIYLKFKNGHTVTYGSNVGGYQMCVKNGLWFNIMGAHVADISINLVLAFGLTVTYEDA